MDLKDPPSSSSSSSAILANKEDDVVLSVTAKDASAAFRSGRFAECADLLNQLLQKKDDDPKVLHNVAIVSFLRDGCSNPRKLLESLDNVKQRIDELVNAYGEQADSGSNIGNKAVTGSKGANGQSQQFSSSSSSQICCGDEFDTALIMFNKAVILFYLHEYAKAYSILDSLFQKIEPLDEATALRICLLFLDVALASRDPWRFVDVINYMEKAFCVSNPICQGDDDCSLQGSSDLMTKSSSLSSSTVVTDASNSDLIANSNASESALSRSLSEENLETLISTIDMSGQNPTRPHPLRTPTDQFISTSDLRLKLQLYKVRYLLFTRNLKAAKREVKTAMPMNLACGKDSSMALLLKSQLEYARGNYPKAIKLLTASSNKTDMGISIIHNSNLGCIYYRLGKYHTSSIFFSRALSSSSSLRKEKPLKFSSLSEDKSRQIVYNCGVQYLACRKPILAARCFQKSSLAFNNRPLLWVRIAECCLMAFDEGLLRSGQTRKKESEVDVHVIGEGKWRQLAVETAVGGEKFDFVLAGDDKQPKLSLSFARQCLLNALHLLDSSESKPMNSFSPQSSTLEDNETKEAGPASKYSNHKNVSSADSKMLNLKVGLGQLISNGDGKEQRIGNNSNVALLNSILDFEDLGMRENHMLRQAVLADLSFVELELGNPLKALLTSRSLLELKECSRIFTFLGHVYAAESLCLLNRPREASEHLLTYLSSESKVEIPYSEEDCDKWRVVKTFDCEDSSVRNPSPNESQDVVLLKPEEARGTLCIELATMFALDGDIERAHQFATEGLALIPNSREAILTAIFTDLAMGNMQEALAKLRQCSHIRFLPSNSTLKSSCC